MNASKKFFYRTDARTKVFLLFFVGFASFLFVNLFFDLAIIFLLTILLLLNRQYQMVIKSCLFYLICLFVEFGLLNHYRSNFFSYLYGFITIFRIFIPTAMAAYLLIYTTTVNEFITSFRKMHVPDSVTLSLSVLFRFIPTIKEEWQCIRHAMMFRGINFRSIFLRPFLTLEYVLVPMMMSTAVISEELAAASLARGLDNEKPRTSMTEVYLNGLDYFVIIYCLTLSMIQIIRINKI